MGNNTAKLVASSAEIDRMCAAAAELAQVHAAFADNFSSLAPGAGCWVEWQHYPLGDVYDPRSHSQYFYHIHPPGQRTPGEHGHFHTFLRAAGMPPGVAPLMLPETAVAEMAREPQAAPITRGSRDEVSHLVGITLNARREPIRLFTTNRWVTGESWYRAEDVVSMLGCFTLDGADGPTLLNRWLAAVLGLFRPQIAALLRLRDETVMGWRRRRRSNVFEDARLEETSHLDIDVSVQLELLRRLRAGSVVGAGAGSARLRQIAEGWGEGHAR